MLMLIVGACAPATPVATPASVTPSPSSTGSPRTADGPLPIVISTDMAGDGLLAVMALLREPTVDIRAIAIDGNGEVHCVTGVNNMLHLLEAFGRDDIPIGCGREEPGPSGRLFPDAWRDGADRFYGVELPPLKGSTAAGDAPQLIVETLAASDAPMTLVPLGTWTNIADAFAADPTIVDRVARIHAMGGAIDVPGNIDHDGVKPEHGVEWNLGVDPESVAAVMATNVPVTLVPLDATNDVPVPPDFAVTLQGDHGPAGADIAFEMFARSSSLTQGTSFWDTLAVMARVDPSLVEWEELTATVETEGLSAGRILRSPTGRPIRAAMSADAERFVPALLEALRRGAPRPEPFQATTMTVRWDGTGCSIEGGSANAGTVIASLVNDATEPVGIGMATTIPPKTWRDAIDFVRTSDPANPEAALPDWLVELGTLGVVEPDAPTTSIIEIPAGEVGAVCATGTWPDLEYHDGGSFVVEP